MGCQPAPTCAAALAEATRRWPGRDKSSDGICGDAAHAARVSDHNPAADGFAHAFDLTHDPAHGVDTYDLADELRRRMSAGREKRIKYVISNRRIASPEAGWAWRAYSGANPHDKHFHISVTPEATQDTAPWFGFLDAAPTPTPQPPEDDMFDANDRAKLAATADTLDRLERRSVRLVEDDRDHATWLILGGVLRAKVRPEDIAAYKSALRFGAAEVWGAATVDAIPLAGRP